MNVPTNPTASDFGNEDSLFSPISSDDLSQKFELEGNTEGDQAVKLASNAAISFYHHPQFSECIVVTDLSSEMLPDDDFYTDGQLSWHPAVNNTIEGGGLVPWQKDAFSQGCIESPGEWDTGQMISERSMSALPRSLSISSFSSSELVDTPNCPEHLTPPFSSPSTSEDIDPITFHSDPGGLGVERPRSVRPDSQSPDQQKSAIFMETKLRPREWVLEQLEMMAAEVLFDMSYQFPPKVVTQSRTRSDAISYDKQSGVIRRKRQLTEGCQGSLEHDGEGEIIGGTQRPRSEKVLTKTAWYGANNVGAFESTIRIASLVHDNLLQGTVSTKRDVFYRDVQLFRSQPTVDRIVEDLACSLQVPRSCLNVVAGCRSVVYGSIRISIKTGRRSPGSAAVPNINSKDPGWLREDILQGKYGAQATPSEASESFAEKDNDRQGNTISKTDFNTLVMIPVTMDDIIEVEIHPGTRFVLVVEKEATMQNLISSGFCESNGPCILLTSKGYPDQAARRLLRLLSDIINAGVWSSLQLPHQLIAPCASFQSIMSKLDSPTTIPLLALVDCDPHGIEIFLTYRCGSIQSAYDNANLAIPSMQCIGQVASDWREVLGGSREGGVASNNIQEQFRRALLPLTYKDRAKLVKLLTAHPLVMHHGRWRSEISRMLHLNRKTEIQSLCLVDSRQQSEVATAPPLIQYLNRKLSSREEWL